jgi:hypothetical protein
MYSIKDDMEGGFNDFVLKQKETEGNATMTLAQFDNHYEVVHDNVSVGDMPNLSLQPRGSTALLDAIGKTLTNERKRIKDMDSDDQPEKVICVIITDGDENCSREYSKDQVFKMITNLEDAEEPQWDFVFLGANQDAIASGGNMGMRAASSITYDASSAGTTMAFKSLSKNVSDYRSSAIGVNYSFSEEDRAVQDSLINKDDKFDKSIPTLITDLDSED